MHELPLQGLVPPLLQLCCEAGEVICEHYHAPGAGRFESKSDDSPLTQADLASHAVLQAGLMALAEAVPVLSEESTAQEQSQRRHWSRYWLVDPLDGTKEFLGRTGEFTINIALIEHHRPILGILYVPLEKQAYVGIPGSGAWLYNVTPEGGGQFVQKLATRRLCQGQPLIVLASRRHRSARLQKCLDWLRRQWGEIERLNSGSALKFCQMAAAGGDFYPRFSPCCEWDTAAGQALLEAAGGALLGLDGLPLRYNCRDTLLNPDFYAVADPGHALWQQIPEF